MDAHTARNRPVLGMTIYAGVAQESWPPMTMHHLSHENVEALWWLNLAGQQGINRGIGNDHAVEGHHKWCV